MVLVCCKWEVFFLPPTGSDLQCSASLLLRRFSQISESCFSSEPAGRQAAVSREYLLFPRCIRDHRQHRPFSVLLLFGFFFEARNQQRQQHHRWKPNKLHHNTETFFLSILLFFFLFCLSAVFPWIVSVCFSLTDWIAALDFIESRLDFGDSSSSSSSSTQPPPL